MKYFNFLILMLYGFYLQAQVAPVQGVPLNPIDQSIFSQWASEIDNKSSRGFVEGSPYLFKDWAKGEITTIKGDHHTNLDLKLNLFTSQLIYKNPLTNDSTLIMSHYLSSFQLSTMDTTFTFYLISPNQEKKKKMSCEDFFLVLLKGKNSLLARPEVKIKRATQNSLVNAGGQIKDRYSRFNEYYLLLESGEILTIRNSKKALIKSFDYHQDDMKKFMKDKNSDISNPIHLAALVSHYNTLD